MKLLLPLLLALTVSTVTTRGENPEPRLNVSIEVHMVSMPLEKGLPLLPNLRHAGSIEGAFSQIQKMIAEGEAKLVGWPHIVTKSGQRAVAEDIQEIRYSTEYNGSTPVTAPNPKEKSKAAPAGAAPIAGGAPVPTAFETRNAGSTLEVEPVLGPDGKTLDLNLAPQYVRLLESAVVASGRDAQGHDWKIEQPRFFAAKTTTSVTVTSGQRLFLADFRGPEGSEDILFFILKADVVPVDAAKAK